MADYYVGQILMFGGNFSILGTAFCNGQLMEISQNTVLFSLIGTTYGGDGVTTFGLPDMRGRLPVHQGQLSGGGSYSMGQLAGTETITLTSPEMPAHTHTPLGNSADGGLVSPANNFWGASPSNIYSTTAPAAAMNTAAVGLAGGSQPHNNMKPYLCISFLIVFQGIFPPRN